MPTQQEVFNYLNKLRESGETNMLGAVPYLQRQFQLTKGKAEFWLWEWINSFKEANDAN